MILKATNYQTMSNTALRWVKKSELLPDKKGWYVVRHEEDQESIRDTFYYNHGDWYYDSTEQYPASTPEFFEWLDEQAVPEQDEKFTIQEIKNYLLSQESRGDIMYNLSAENIVKANEK